MATHYITYVYNANGGSGAPASSSSYYNNTSGSYPYTVSKQLSTERPSRTGYSFLGWSLSASATTAQYQPGANYSHTFAAASENEFRTTFYAVWSANKYNVVYRKGANGTGTEQSTTKTYGVALTLLGAIFTRTGYHQAGWSTTDGGAKAYDLQGSYTDNQAVELYPYWEVNALRVRFAVNGGSLASAHGSGITVENGYVYLNGGRINQVFRYSTTSTLNDYNDSSYINLVRTGYSVPSGKEWFYQGSSSKIYLNQATSYTGKTLAAALGVSIENNDVTIEVSCNWEKATYTVSYNKGSYGTGTNQTATKTYGEALTLKGAIFTRDGYNQSGWYSNVNGTITNYSLNGSYTTNAAVTLYPTWTLKTYTITYNKGSNGTGTNTTATKTHGTALTLKGAIFTRTGYTQTGWSTTDGGSKAYDLSASYTANAAATLYPYWSLQTYTISYNANGGSGAPSSQTKTYGVALTLSSTKPTRSSTSGNGYVVTLNANGGSVSTTSLQSTRTTSYTFSKWNTAANGSGTYYNSGASYTANAAATMYAIYTTSSTNSAVTLPTPTRTGYNFNGWATSSSASSGSTGSYTPSNNVTLYATWSKVTYTVSYNKGSYGTGTNQTATKTYGEALTLKGAIFTRTGYTQTGWSKTDGGSLAYSTGGSYETNAAITLYPYWTANTYTITYNANGGSGAPASQTKTYGVTLTLSSTKPTRSGYSFVGWGTSSTATTATYQPGGSYTANEAATLYAVWTTATYTVSYNKGTYGSGTNQTDTKINGVTLTLKGAIFTREGYHQIGWSTTDGGDQAYALSGSYTANAAVTLYPVWGINYLRIQFAVNGGSLIDPHSSLITQGNDGFIYYNGNILRQNFAYGSSSTINNYNNSNFINLARTGYHVDDGLEWNTAANGNGTSFDQDTLYSTAYLCSIFDVDISSASQIVTIYCNWKINTYTVSYNANGGSGAPSSQTKTYGVNLTLSSTVPTLSGKSFKGWATSATATTPLYQAGGTYTANDSATLYAVWETSGFLRIMQSNGTLKLIPLYYMTANGLVPLQLYRMQQNGTLKQEQ